MSNAARGIFLLEIDAWTGTAVERLHLATKSYTTSPSDTPPNTFYDGRIVDLGSMQRSLFGNGGTLGPASVSTSAITLANADGVLDPWLDYGFDGRRLAIINLDGPGSVVFRGTVQSLDTSDAPRTMRLRIRDRLAELDKPLLTERYLGTTVASAATAEGNADLKDALKQRVFGSAYVAGKLVNEFDLIWQFSAGEVFSLTVYDGGEPLTNIGDFGSIASLRAATIPAGRCATCLALGLVRLGGLPGKGVTADVVEGAIAADRTAAQIALRIFDLYGIDVADIDSDSFDDLDDFNDAEVQIFVDADESCLSVLNKVVGSIGGAICHNNAGLFQVKHGAAPTGTAEQMFTLRDVLTEGQTFGLASGPTNEGDGVPVWSVTVNWGRIWQVQGVGDLGGDPASLTDPVGGLARREFLGKAIRTAVAQDAGVKTAHPRAGEIIVDTLLTSQAAAEAEAARLLALYKVRRDRPVVPLPFEDAKDIEIGDVVDLDARDINRRPRFGWGVAKSFRVVGRKDDFTKRVIALDFFG